MNLQQLRELVISLVQRSLTHLDEDLACLQNAETILHTYLDQNPKDIDALFFLALLVETPPLADVLQAIEAMKRILTYEPTNYTALLMLTVFEDKLGNIPLETFQRLCDFRTSDNDIAAMIEFAKARYFFHYDDCAKQYEDALKKSIRLSTKFAWNYIKLGECLKELGSVGEEERYINQGLANVIQPPEPYTAESFIDANRFINEFITGTQMSQSNYETIQQRLHY